jgi:hypothetical protein
MFLSVAKGIWYGAWGIFVLSCLLFLFGGVVTQGVRIGWEQKRQKNRALLRGYRPKSGKRRLVEWMIIRAFEKW